MLVSWVLGLCTLQHDTWLSKPEKCDSGYSYITFVCQNVVLWTLDILVKSVKRGNIFLYISLTTILKNFDTKWFLSYTYKNKTVFNWQNKK